MWDYFFKNGQTIVQTYFDTIMGVPSRSLVDYYIDVLVDILV